MIEVNKLFFFFFVTVFSKRNRKRVLRVPIELYRNTHESLGEVEKAVQTLTAARVPTAFLVLPNFHLCFYNSIETWHMFYFFKYKIIEPLCTLSLVDRCV